MKNTHTFSNINSVSNKKMNFGKKIIFLLPLFIFCLVGNTFSLTYYASTTGTNTNTGALNSPWNLQHALSVASGVSMGDTIIIQSGVYYGRYTSSLNGSVTSPIVVRGEDKFTTILNGTISESASSVLTVNGSHTHFYDLQITANYTQRISQMSGSGPSDITLVTGINIYGIGSKIINCIVHNVPGVAIGYWKTALDAELYGNIIFHNGWAGTDRGHGHAFYTQNDDGERPKFITNNFAFSQFGNNVDIYVTNPKNKGIHVLDNVCFNTGAPIQSNKERKYNFIAGGVNNATSDLVVKRNIFFRDSTDNGTLGSCQNVKLGYSFPDSNVVFDDNHVFGNCNLTVRPWYDLKFTNNTIFRWNPSSSGNPQIINLEDNAVPTNAWNNNQYITENSTNQNLLDGMSLTTWRSNFNADPNSTLSHTRPVNFNKVVRNVYDTTLYYISILNYEEHDTVNLDLSELGFSDVNVKFDIYDVQNFLNGPFLSDVVTSDVIRLPMNLTNVYPIYGDSPNTYKHTTTLLGTFVLKIKEVSTDPSLSIKQIVNKGEDLIVFPNPSKSGIFNFEKKLNGNLSIFDYQGRLVLEQVVSNVEQVNLSENEEGVYFLQLINNNQVYNTKLLFTK